MFRLNESLEMNTKKLCNLNESSDNSAKSLQVSEERRIKVPLPTSSSHVSLKAK